MMKRFANLATRLARGRPPVGSTPSDVVHAENKWRLLHYRAREGGPSMRTPLVLIPSLINRHYVLDLLPGKSFIEWMVARGHDVYCVDWGTPTDEDRWVTFDDVCDRAIGRALRVATRASNVERAHLLGYCLGGTLTAIHAAARPERVATLTTLAAPIRFCDDGLLSAWTNVPAFDVNALVDGLGNVPWQLMQSAFQLLRPTLALSKAVHMIDRAWDDEFLDGFLALETWGNDNVSFPGEFYRRYIDELYRGDAFVKGTFALSGTPARLEAITCPTYCVTFEHDTIVPWESAKVLHDRAGARDKEWLHLKGGHVGAVVSKAAATRLWPKLSEFWASHDGDAPKTEAATRPSTRPSARRSEPPRAKTRRAS